MRYVRANPVRMYWGNDAPMLPNLSVSEHDAVETGLIWEDGTPILRAPNEIGFHAEIDE